MLRRDVMFREMRRRRQQLSPEECKRILAEGTSGVLAVRGDEGYPYAVPLSYVYEEGRLFFTEPRPGTGGMPCSGTPKPPSASSVGTGWCRRNTPPISAA